MSESDPSLKSEPHREEGLFQAAVQLTGVERAAFLNGACHGDPVLHHRLEALLAAHGTIDTFLEPKAPKSESKPLKTIKLEVPDDPEDEAIGTRVGRFKLLEKVGEGGC